MKRFSILLVILWCINVVQVSAQSETAERQDANTIELTALEMSNQWNGKSIRRSIELYLVAADLFEKLGENKNVSNCLLEAARQKIVLGENKEAIAILDHALIMNKKNGNINEKLKTNSLLSIAYLRLGKFDETKSYTVQILKLIKLTGDEEARAIAYSSLAEINYEQGEIDKALSNYEKTLSLWKKCDNLRGESKTLLALSYILMTKGEPLLALHQAEDAFTKFKQSDDLRGQTLAQIAIGLMNSRMDNKQTALDLFQKAEAVFPNDVDFLERGDLYSYIAQIYKTFGDWQISLNYFFKAFELYKKEQNPIAQLATLPNLGLLSIYQGNEILGLKYFHQGFQIAHNLNNEYYRSILLEELGNAFFEKDKEISIKYFKQALLSFEKLKFKNRVSLVEIKIGSIYESRKQFSVARKYYESASKINFDIKDRFAEAETDFHLAKIDNADGKIENALETVSNSIKITNFLYSDIINSKLKGTYSSTVFDRYELYINLLMKKYKASSDENYAIQALQIAEKSRARFILENLSLDEVAFTKDAPPEVVSREKEIRVLLNSKADKLTDILSRKAEKTEADKLDSEISELEFELEDIKGKLKQTSPIYSAIKNPAAFDAGEFQRNILDQQSVLLEFSFGQDESYLWLVSKDSIESFVLPSREQIETRIEKLRKLLDSRNIKENETVDSYQSRIAADESEFGAESKELSRDLFGQISDKITGKRLIIVPDGKLHYFPIAALPFPDSNDNQPILLTNETIYEPSAATLALLMRNSQKTSAATKNLVVFSDPIFSVQDSRIASTAEKSTPEISLVKPENFRFAESLTSLARLDASKAESDSIMEILGASDSTALNGAAATRERALDASIADYKFIHFATHGLINEERPELSGIVLSQIDENGQSRNGVVRLQDIYGMNLKADAVVLSACSTGIGKEVKGEGLMSLNNAFLQTGAKSVVSSLWKVDDYATQELMKNFYQELTSGKTTAEALRKAQIKLRRNPQFESPFYWAAFTVEGDFQNVPQVSKESNIWIYTVLVFPFALIGLIIYRRFYLFNRKVINKS